ncbi:MAG: M20 family metallopeptidase [Halodesulfurarchaeum sp.]
MSFDPIDFLERAVATPSHESVEEMRALLVETLETNGEDPVVDDTGSVVAERGSGTPRICLNTHIDTVSPYLPFERDGTTVRGRGACDAKGPLASILSAFFATEPTEGTLVLAVTPDEEATSRGAAALDPSADGFVVGEPTGLSVCTAARGRFQGTVTISGTGSHAADPERGKNAIAALSAILPGFDSFDDTHGPDAHPTLGSATLTPTVIEGGEAPNRVPATVEITFDRRSVPPERADPFFEALERHLRSLAPGDVTVEVRPAERDTPFLEPFDTPDDAAIVRALSRAGAGDTRPFGAATEASYFAASAPTVVFGPGVLSDDEGPVAHSDREYVSVDSVRRASDILEVALEDLVG